MLVFEVVIVLLLLGAALAALSRRIGAPYPALLALAGAALALLPGLPTVMLDPELALALFVAPVLQLVMHGPVIRGFSYGYMILPWAIPLVMVLGVLGFFVSLWLSKGIGHLHGLWAKVMLVGRFEGAAIQDAQRPV